MNKIIVKAQRLASDFEHDSYHEWEIKSVEELYNFRKIKLPFEHYSHLYVVIEMPYNYMQRTLVTNPMNLGEAVFKYVMNVVQSIFVKEIFI